MHHTCLQAYVNNGILLLRTNVRIGAIRDYSVPAPEQRIGGQRQNSSG